MRERDRTQSIQNKKLLRTTTFSVALLVVVTMVLSTAAPAININMNSTQMNLNTGQQEPLYAGDGFTDLAGEPTGVPTASYVLEKQASYQNQHRGVVVYDNNMGFYTLTSNQEDTAYGLVSEGADDFSFYTGGEDVCIQDVHWIGGCWNGAWQNTAWTIRFYEDDGTGNAPGSLYAGPYTIEWDDLSTKIDIYGTGYYWEFGADIDEVCFPGCGEKFWISIQANHDIFPQYGWGAHYSPIYNHELVWKCDYFGYPDWVDGSSVFGTVLDYAFQLTQKADHDVSVIDINTGEFCECLPIEVVVTNYGKFDEVNVPVHVQITQEYAMFDEFYFDWTYNTANWWEAYYITEGVTPHSLYYMYEFKANAGTYYATCFDTFDFSTACNPAVGFWMWHDQLGSNDYIQVTANGVAVGPQFYRSGTTGWQKHIVELPAGTTTIGFKGVADSIYAAYPIFIDDVSVFDLMYDETVLVDIDVGKTVTVAFPDFCPCQWHVVEDVTLNVDITACTEMVGDQTVANDCLTVPASMYLPFFHDVGGVDLTIEDQGCLEYDVCATIANLGQYEECCFKTYVNIYNFIEGPITTLYSNDFNSQVYYGFPAGWTTDHPSNWWCYYDYFIHNTYSMGVLWFYWSPSFVGTSRAYTMAINTAGMYQLTISFNHYLSHYGGPYSLRVETSNDAVNWVTAKEWVNPTGWTSTPESIQCDVTGSTTYVAFTFEGDSFNLNYWVIDDLLVQGRSGGKGDLDYSEWYCVDVIDICEEQEFCFDSWVPAQPWPDCGSKLYLACVETALCDPMDENPINDEYCEYVRVDFNHDVEVAVTSPAKTRNIAYASDAYPGYTMNSFDLATPGTQTILGPYTGSGFCAAGTWADGVWYVADYYSAALMTADTTTGALTTIGGSGTTYNGIAWDITTDTMYGASSYNLYTIDITTGAQTMVGSWGSSYLMIDIGIDNAGQIYGHDIITDSMYLIDKNTGAATLLGSTGQSCNYAQGMEYDHDNGILYAAAYTSGGNLFTVDTATGLFTLVGAFAGGAEMDGFAIPYAGGGVNLPKADIWIPCGEQEICATVTNNGVFDEVDDPSTPCDWEGVTVYYEMYWYYLDDPCEDPIVELVGEGMEQIELLCGEEYEVCFDYDFEETGIYQFIVWATIPVDCDEDNNADTFNIGVDCCDPISEHTLTPLIPDGQNNWYKQDVTVKITAYDPLCPDPCYGTSSKLKEIHYVINGVETVKADDEVTFKIKDEGVNLVKYWAVDNAGNVEDVFTFEIAIDKTAPEVTMWYERIEDGTVQIKFTAAVFEGISGVDHVEFYIGDTLTETYTDAPFEYTVTWQASYKTTNFIFKAYDGAGNVGQASIYGGDIDMVRPRAAEQSQAQGQSQALQSILAQQI